LCPGNALHRPIQVRAREEQRMANVNPIDLQKALKGVEKAVFNEG